MGDDEPVAVEASASGRLTAVARTDQDRAAIQTCGLGGMTPVEDELEDKPGDTLATGGAEEPLAS